MRLLLMLLALCAAFAAVAAPGNLEARTYASVWPEPIDDFGAGFAIELGVVPEDFPVLGQLVGGHTAFFDVIQLENRTILGASGSLLAANKDNGIRVWVGGTVENGGKPLAWGGLSYAIPIDW